MSGPVRDISAGLRGPAATANGQPEARAAGPGGPGAGIGLPNAGADVRGAGAMVRVAYRVHSCARAAGSEVARLRRAGAAYWRGWLPPVVALK